MADPEFKNAGEEETKPGQTEVEAGSVEHQQVLKAFPNATSYGPDVNVVLPPPETPPDPPSTLSGGAYRAPDKLPESTPKPGEPHSKPTDSKLDKKEDKK